MWIFTMFLEDNMPRVNNIQNKPFRRRAVPMSKLFLEISHRLSQPISLSILTTSLAVQFLEGQKG